MSLGRLKYFFTTLGELNLDGGVSIRMIRTNRRFMNIQINHPSNELYLDGLFGPNTFTSSQLAS